MSKEKPSIPSALHGRVVALPETRQLDLLASMFERRGAVVIRVPLMTILDSPNTAVVQQWLAGFIAHTPDYLVILTGEGIRRLAGFAERDGCLAEFVAALSRTVKVCRGPKPGRALQELELKPDLLGDEPTTQGIISALDRLELAGRCVAVQLYGEDPNHLLMAYLSRRGARVSAVAPYVYAPKADEERVLRLIDDLLAARVEVIAFTSKPQFARLLQVATENDRKADLLEGLERSLVAAVGPVVAAQLQEHGVRVDMTPSDAFFMKPMVRAIERRLSGSDTHEDDQESD